MEKATQTLEELEALSPEEIGEAFHELSINQIELEMQNEELRRTQVELETARESYFDLYDQAPVGYITLNEKGQILEANLTASSLLGESRKVLVRQMFSQFILKGDEDIYYLMRKQLFKTGNRQNCELRMRKKGGPDFCARLDATLGLEKGSGAAMALVMLNDITEQKMVRERLVESEMRYRALFEHAAMGVAMIETRTGRYYDINQEYCDFLGYTREEALNMTFQDVTYAEDVQENLDKNALLLSGKIREFTIEKRYVRKDGSIVWGTLTGSALWEPGQEIRENYHIALVQDITERKRTEDKNRLLNAELEHLALTDYLTNLYNRRYFMRRSAEEFKRARRNNHPLALLMLDIDRFKNINDSYGHEVGDLALQHIAAALKASLREIDILGRLGGEEFAVLLPDTPLADAAVLAERIRHSIATLSFQTPGGVVIRGITVSIGAAPMAASMTGIDDLLRNGDTAMYGAKNNGRNRIEVFHEN